MTLKLYLKIYKYYAVDSDFHPFQLDNPRSATFQKLSFLGFFAPKTEQKTAP